MCFRWAAEKADAAVLAAIFLRITRLLVVSSVSVSLSEEEDDEEADTALAASMSEGGKGDMHMLAGVAGPARGVVRGGGRAPWKRF